MAEDAMRKLIVVLMIYVAMVSGATVGAQSAEEQYQLGMRYIHGDGVVTDAAEAEKWFRKAFARK